MNYFNSLGASNQSTRPQNVTTEPTVQPCFTLPVATSMLSAEAQEFVPKAKVKLLILSVESSKGIYRIIFIKFQLKKKIVLTDVIKYSGTFFKSILALVP